MPGPVGSKLPPPLLYLAGILLGLGLDRVLPIVDAPPGFWLPGLALVLAGLALDAWALWRLRAARTTILPWGEPSALVTDGPFRVSRNPIYVGYALEYVGAALWIGTVWGWILLPVVLAVMDRVLIPREERALDAAFGPAYASYRARVRRWV